MLRTQAYVGGMWTDADSGETFPVENPATGETIADVPRLGAVGPAARSRPQPRAARLARSPGEERARAHALVGLMAGHEGDLAALMVLEQEQPLAEARTEVAYAASFYEWFAERRSVSTAASSRPPGATSGSWSRASPWA